MSSYGRKPPTGITRSTFAVPVGSFSASQSIPVGTVEAWVTFNVAPGDLTVRYAGQQAQLELLSGGTVQRWDLFPAGHSLWPLNVALGVEFQATNSGVTATLHTRQEPGA